ncbi:MAG: hypothetical protein KJO62_09125 [Gammaproteobacteria bacterium]|nr:hypothetical protein [Gammaproteobacteria bacterium]NNM11136.1 hypothetical protein [Pseudomonadales bacterium]
MDNLFKLLLFIFLGVGLMVVVLERFGKPMDAETQYRWSRWVIPLCVVLLVAQLIRHYWV